MHSIRHAPTRNMKGVSCVRRRTVQPSGVLGMESRRFLPAPAPILVRYEGEVLGGGGLDAESRPHERSHRHGRGLGTRDAMGDVVQRLGGFLPYTARLGAGGPHERGERRTWRGSGRTGPRGGASARRDDGE